jgi:hypothetical protein
VTHLRLVPSPDEIALGGATLSLAEDPPFVVQATVHEEDTFLVLSADRSRVSVQEHPLRVIDRAYNARAETPGTVRLAAGDPTRLLAVIHDLDREPSTCEEWVLAALRAVLDLCVERQLASVALPLVGSVHGVLPARTAADLLVTALVQGPGRPYPRRIWLQLDGRERDLVGERLLRCSPA